MLVLVVVSIAALIKNGGHLELRAVRAQPHHQRLQRPGRRLPAGDLPVHRLGELGGAGRGDRQPAAQRAAGRVPVGRPHGGQLPAVRPTPPSPASTTTPPSSAPRRSRSSPSPTASLACAGLLRLPGRADLHPRRADLGGQLAVPADLQRRPRGPAAALDRPGPPDPPHAGQRHLSPSSPSPARSSWSGRSAT